MKLEMASRFFITLIEESLGHTHFFYKKNISLAHGPLSKISFAKSDHTKTLN